MVWAFHMWTMKDPAVSRLLGSLVSPNAIHSPFGDQEQLPSRPSMVCSSMGVDCVAPSDMSHTFNFVPPEEIMRRSTEESAIRNLSR